MNVITMGSSFPVGFSLFSHFEKITEKPLRITKNPPRVYPPSLIDVTEQNNPNPFFIYEILKK